MSVVKVHLPRLMIIENLKELHQAGDSDYIIEVLNAAGYWAASFDVEAMDYSSKTARLRCLFACVLELRRSETRAEYMRNTLRILKLPPHSIKEFLTHTAFTSRDKKARVHEQLDYLSVHAELYDSKGLGWPPKSRDLNALEGFISFQIQQRPLESAYFCTKVYAYSKCAADADGFQFLDLNVDLKRLVQEDGSRNPWSVKIGTITTKAIWLARYEEATAEGFQVTHRVLTGADLLQLAGYDQQFCLVPLTKYNSDDLTLLSGNALNAFSLSAFMISLFTALRQRRQEKEEENPNDDDASQEGGSSEEQRRGLSSGDSDGSDSCS